MATVSTHAPQTFEDAAELLGAAAAAGRPVRILGAGTKARWGGEGAVGGQELRTTALDAILAHDPGDMTATLQAGVPLQRAQRTFAAAGQMLALDPPLGVDGGAGPTIGGVVATADSGPLRHRYGGARDLVVGMTVALSDGTIARSGGTVIKNVAGYDLAKLFSGAFGTLGLILSVNVRLHPLHDASVTAMGATGDPARLSAAATALSAAPLEFESLDVAWRDGRGGLLARCAGPQAHRRADRAAALIREHLDGVEVTAEDGQLWERQRAGQRSADQVLLRVAAPPSTLTGVLSATQATGATLVGRAASGHSYIEVAPDAAASLRSALPGPAAAVVLDAPPGAAEPLDPWGPEPPAPVLDLMRRVKARFDPAGICNPGLFVGGI